MSIVEKALVKVRTGDPASQEPRSSEASQGSAKPAEAFHESLSGDILRLDASRLRDRGLLPDDEMGAAIDEQLRRLKWPLLEGAIGRNAAAVPYGRVIMVTSSVPGEGKTFCSFNLALSIARERTTAVVLIDGDVRKADLTRSFGTEGRPGLVEWASTPSLSLRDVALRTSVPRLSFVPAGCFDPLVPEIWAGKRMETLVHQLATLDANTIVILDSSPVLATNETQVLSYLVGQIAFVVRADSTPQSDVVEAIGMLDPDAKISCVLNQAHQSAAKHRYYPEYSAERGVRTTGLDAAK